MTMTLEQFATQLDDSGVLSAEDLASFKELHCPEVESAEDLGKLLVKHNKVTRLQAQMVYQGQGDKLRFGNYVIQDKIGSGGMGDVYLARHRRMQREVALKLLPTAMAEDQNVIRRFQREVHAAAKLSHPNIVTAHDADEVDGTHYLVMEYVSGTDLSALVKQQGVLPVGQALDYILQAARGLEYAHQAGIIHRDIKPSNMLLDDNGTIKILDMGLARIDEVDEENPATALTQSGSVMGTVDYMSPEQAQSTHTADNRSDIYSLGCTLYYLLTGNSVYGGKTVVNRILAHRDQPIPSLASTNVQVPANVDAIYQKMIAKLPEDRFQSMQAVIDAIEKCDLQNPASTMSTKPSDPELQKFLQSQKVESSPTIVMPAGEIEAGTQDLNPTSDFLNDTLNGTAFQPLQRPQKSKSKRGWVFAGLALAAFVFLAGIVFKVETPAGTVILEVDQPAAAGAMVSVDEEQKITINTGKNQEPIQVTADAKTHTLKVTKGGFETFTRQFTVKSGQTETIKVHLVPLVVPETADSAPIMPFPMTDREIVEWILSVGGSVAVNSERNNLTSIKDMPAKPVEYYGVNLCNAKIPPHDLQRLANLKPLYSLKLSGESVAEQDLQYLKFVKGVHDLSLDNFILEGDGLKYLSGFQSLKSIRVNDSTIRGEGLSHLGQFLNLITLDLVACTIDSAVLQQIGNRRQLNFLNLSNSQIDDAGLAHLSGLTKLKKFYAHMNPKITDEGLKHLQGMQQLEVLTVGGTGITDAGLKQIGEHEQLILLDSYNIAITDAGLAHLTKLKHLNSLDLRRTPITDAGLKHLSGLKQLKTLTLQETNVTPGGIAALKRALPNCKIESNFKTAMLNGSPKTEREIAEWVIGLGGSVAVNGMSCKQIADLPDEMFEITAVALRESEFEDDQLASLANLKKLTGLYLDSSSISDTALTHLGKLQQLQRLNLAKTKITGAGLSSLGEIPGLMYLDLSESALTNVGLKNIGNLKQLVTLNIPTISGIDDTGLAHIAGLTNLQELYLHNNPQLTDDGIKHLQGMHQLTELTLANTGFSDAGMKYLSGIKDLEKLHLANCQRLSDAGIEHLANLKKLKSLLLFLTPITDAGLKHLHGLKKLEMLDLRDTKVTSAGITALKQALPNCKIESNFKAAMLNGSPKTEREIAEWIISIGGRVAVNRISCKKLAEIPDGAVVIDAINLREKNLKDLDLAPLAYLKKLEVLYLDSNPISDTALQYFSELPLLNTLSLPKTRITGDGVNHLENLTKLLTLDLESAKVTNGGLKNIGNLNSLLSLNIADGDNIDDAGLAHLAGLTKLKKLFAQRNPDITDEGMKHLQGMQELELLSLGGTGITDVGLKQIAGHEKLNRLEIYNTQITDTGLEQLAKLKNLSLLALQATPITDTGLKHLHGLEQLEQIDLHETKVTPAGIAALQQALPNCQIKSEFTIKPAATK
ncbi:MAG: protein kinase [Gimesia chilikensis]|uniref:protein kinase domain-containing protein n=1 Tax=Gimesia chilikensis TaxID=2605989 RepID=UPI0037BA7DC3